MDNKNTLLIILEQAKRDYKASIIASNNWLTRRSSYKKLKTNQGLCEYFLKASNACNIVFKHLRPFRPDGASDHKWFSVGTRAGLKMRLSIIEQAIEYYKSKSEWEVPLILRNDYLINVHLYSAYVRGARTPDDRYMEAVYNYFNENEDEMYGEDEDTEN